MMFKLIQVKKKKAEDKDNQRYLCNLNVLISK